VKARLLVADDDERFRQSTADLLEQAGYDCACVADAADALDQLRTGDFDVLIADIKMPGNAELELVGSIRDVAEGLPIILVTGFPSIDSAIKSVEMPVFAYLTKPVDFPQLRAHVEAAVDRRRTFRAIQNSRASIETWHAELVNAERLMSEEVTDASGVTTGKFMELTYRNIAGALLDLKRLVESVSDKETTIDACHLLGCPRIDTLTQAIREAVQALERTKGTFKSKEIARVRRELENVLDQPEAGD